MQDIIFLLMIFFGLLGSAFFSGAETATTSVMHRIKLKQMVRDKHKDAVALMALLERKGDILSATLIGTNIANVLASSLATLLAIKYSSHIGELVVVLVMTITILIFGEILPKALGRYYALPISLRIVPLLKWSLWIFWPLVAFFNKMSGAILSSEKNTEAFFATKEELRALVDEGKERGMWDKQSHKILHNIFDLEKAKVKDMVVPMSAVKWVEKSADIKDLETLAAQTGYTRFPVYDQRKKKVLGVVSIYDIIFEEGTIPTVKSIMRPILEVGSFKPIDDFLREMRVKREAMAVIKDPRGRHIGIITMEDILEDIVGEIE